MYKSFKAIKELSKDLLERVALSLQCLIAQSYLGHAVTECALHHLKAWATPWVASSNGWCTPRANRVLSPCQNKYVSGRGTSGGGSGGGQTRAILWVGLGWIWVAPVAQRPCARDSHCTLYHLRVLQDTCGHCRMLPLAPLICSPG